MNRKRIIWILILVLFIIGIIVIITMMNKSNFSETSETGTNEIKIGRNSDNNNNNNNNNNSEENENKEYKKILLDDGVLYTKTGEQVEADLVIKENYYDTTINDIYMNPEDYKDKNIEIEGMYLLSGYSCPYTFVGRYSQSNLCPNCPSGYSVLEYQLDGTIDETFKNEETWIKVIGNLEKDYDDETDEEYYYIKVKTLEIMNEKGNDTVSN